MTSNPTTEVVDQHIRLFFAGHAITSHQFQAGPAVRTLPHLRVLQVAPGPRTGCWVYLSLGASTIVREDSGLLEFFLITPAENASHVELVTMIAWYHQTRGLGHGHTVPIGRPWLPDSALDHLLVSTPYPFQRAQQPESGAESGVSHAPREGCTSEPNNQPPELEVCNFDGGHVHFLWLLPITSAEREFKKSNGLEALEQRFEDAAIEYWLPSRASVV